MYYVQQASCLENPLGGASDMMDIAFYKVTKWFKIPVFIHISFQIQVALERKSAQAGQHAKDLRKCEKKHKLYLQIDEQKHDIDRIKKELVYAQFNESKYRQSYISLSTVKPKINLVHLLLLGRLGLFSITEKFFAKVFYL